MNKIQFCISNLGEEKAKRNLEDELEWNCCICNITLHYSLQLKMPSWLEFMTWLRSWHTRAEVLILDIMLPGLSKKVVSLSYPVSFCLYFVLSIVSHEKSTLVVGKWIEYDDDNPIPQREEDIVKLSGGGRYSSCPLFHNLSFPFVSTKWFSYEVIFYTAGCNF